MSKLPEFIRSAAIFLQQLSSFQYFSYSFKSGRYFDSTLLADGFSFIYARNKLKVDIFAGDKSETRNLVKGEILIIPEVYKLELTPRQSSYLKISVTGLFLKFTDKSNQQEESYTCECHPISENRHHLSNLFKDFQESYKREGDISRFRTMALLKLLLADLLDMADGHRNDYYEKGKGRESYNKLIGYISNNFDQVIDANKISERLGLSVQYLNSLANEFRSMSLKEMVNFYRLEKAREKLVNEIVPVSEIALACGFTGSAYFIKLFRKTYGITPLQCRKKLTKRNSKNEKELHMVLNFKLIEGQCNIPSIELDASRKVTMVIANTSVKTAVVYWQDPSDPEVEMHRLKAGQRVTLGTGFGECWTVRRESGVLIGHFSVPASCCQIII